MKAKLEKQIKHLAKLVQEQYHELDDIGVLGGQAGAAMFQFYCAQYFDDDSYSQTGVEIISNCIDKINNGYSLPSYCNGIAGFGWTLQHMADNDFVELNLDELLAPFDDYLFNQMEFEFNKNYFDLLHGALGYGFYFLKRYASPNASQKNKKKYSNFLTELVNSMERIALKDGENLKWKSPLSNRKRSKGFNLSLSHGMSSIIYLSFKMFNNDIQKAKTSNLVYKAINYISKYQSIDNTGNSLFPNWIEPGIPNEYQSRVAWCYGDIGIGKAFEWAGYVLKNNDLEVKAKDILLHTSTRRNIGNTLVKDAGFCHGSFGNAHIFNQLGNSYEEKKFEKAAQFWLKDGLSRKTIDNNQPYKHLSGTPPIWDFHLSLLEGISGIGLVMIDFLSEKENTWDECLMLR